MPEFFVVKVINTGAVWIFVHSLYIPITTNSKFAFSFDINLA